MSKIKNAAFASFGERLKQLRKDKGFTQQELADEVGVSRRVIIYYERESQHPPSSILPGLAKALTVSIDELLDLKATKKGKAKSAELSPRLARRLHQIEQLNVKDKRQLLQIIDTFVENEKLKKSTKQG